METPFSTNPSAKDFLEVLERNRTAVTAPFLAIFTLGTAGAFLWPDTYLAAATIRVAPPAAKADFIPDFITVGLAERVASMQQAILSRNTLTGLIETFNLYRGERARFPLEDVIERMRRDIVVSPLMPAATGRPDRHQAFRVAFSYSDRFEAFRVTQNLTNRLLDENTRERARLIDSVNQFLRDEYERADAELRSAEEKLSAYRRAVGGGELHSPGVQLHQLTLLDTRASAAQAGLSRARQEQVLLEAELRAARDRVRRAALPMTAAPPQSASASAPVPRPAPRGLEALELEFERLSARYKPTHPDVERLRTQIEALRTRAGTSEFTAAPPAPPSPTVRPTIVVPTPDPDAAERVLRAEAQLRAKSLEVARLEAEIGETARATERLRGSMTHSPDRALEGDQLARGHELALQRHREARRRQLEGEAASKSNRWLLGETLELLDSPVLPETPVSPNRLGIMAASAVLGLLAGALMVGLREWNDEAIQTVRQLGRLSSVKVLGGIPLLETELAVRRRRRVAMVGWATASLASAVSITGAILYHHYRQP